MLAIFPAPNANINVGNFDHVVVEYNIERADISCRLYHPYIQQVPKLQIFTKYANINFVNIPSHFFHETVFSLWKYNIEGWLLIPHIINSMNVGRICYYTCAQNNHTRTVITTPLWDPILMWRLFFDTIRVLLNIGLHTDMVRV